MQKEPLYEVCDPNSQGKGGSYGIVKKAKCLKTGKFFAIKYLKYGMSSQGITPSAIRQITHLKQLSGHSNIISLKDNFISDGNIYLVFDYKEMNLRQFIFQRKLTPQLIKSIVKQLLLGLQFSHSRRIMHRDIKPQNILVTQPKQSQNQSPNLLIKESVKVEIADWGLSRLFNKSKQEYTLEVVSLPYRAPEIILGLKEYNQTVDIWSVGCIFIEMLLGKRIFNGQNQISQLESIIKVIGIPNVFEWSYFRQMINPEDIQHLKQNVTSLDQIGKNIDKSALDLLKNMLCFNPQKRSNAKKCLEHKFFT